MLRRFLRKICSFYPYSIAAFVLLLCILVYPVRLFGVLIYQNAALDKGAPNTVAFSNELTVAGIFTPTHERLQSLTFYFLTSGQIQDGEITLNLYDDMQQLIGTVTLQSGDLMNYRPTVFPLKLDLDTTRKYMYELHTIGYPEGSLSMYTGSPAIGPSESEAFFYNSIRLDGVTPCIDYTYYDHADSTNFLIYDVLICLFGLILFAVCHKFKQTIGEENHEK